MKIIETEKYKKIAGKYERGKRDGTGSYEGSAQRSISDKGKRKMRGEECPVKEEKKKKKKLNKKEAANMSQKIKSKINMELSNNGLDGNGRFPEADSGISVIWNILSNYNLALSGTLSKDLFMGNKGRRNLEMEVIKSTSNNPFVPGEEIENSMIVYTWEELEPGKFEILVYLS